MVYIADEEDHPAASFTVDAARHVTICLTTYEARG